MLPYNTLSADAGLCDLLDQLKRNIFLTLNCHAHVTVTSFDPLTQTISATVNYQKTIFESSSPGQTPVGKAVNFAPIINFPVYFLQGDGGSFTAPVSPGDQAMVAFNDRDMDNYLAASVVTTSNTGRSHSFSDGFAFVGVNPLKMALSNFDMLRVLMQYQGAKVGCSNMGVLIKSGDVTLKQGLDALSTALTNFMTALTTSNLSSQAAMAFTEIEAAKAQIDGVLE
jgi:hypothetical protein